MNVWEILWRHRYMRGDNASTHYLHNTLSPQRRECECWFCSKWLLRTFEPNVQLYVCAVVCIGMNYISIGNCEKINNFGHFDNVYKY